MILYIYLLTNPSPPSDVSVLNYPLLLFGLHLIITNLPIPMNATQMPSTPIPFIFPSHASRGVVVVESAPFYQILQPPIPQILNGEERADEQLAEDVKLRLHLDSLPLPQSVRLHEYSIPSCGIRWDVLDKNVTTLLGEEAYLWNTVKTPMSHSIPMFLYSLY